MGQVRRKIRQLVAAAGGFAGLVALLATLGNVAPLTQDASAFDVVSGGVHAPITPEGFPADFSAAKRMLNEVHADHRVEIYCACAYTSGLDVLPGCPVEVDRHEARASRIEWEHVVPASDFGRQRACWRNAPQGQSGRDWCRDTDAEFRAMEADPHNLQPAIGALNALRSNYRLGMVPRASTNQFGDCGFKMEGRVVEPPDAAKGLSARTYKYMEHRYGLRISDSQRRLFDAWDRQFPPSAWEVERNRRVAARIGVENPFVSAAR